MDLQEIANEVDKAGEQLIRCGMKLLDEGRRLESIANDIRYERLHPTTLGGTINDVRSLAHDAEYEIDDAASIIARVPYGDVSYG
ncbi:hypothetical protein [Rhodococcus sp. HS-D2]|uniref:hypothetical protein n=1 Tax=Rhodococcus sp. HS-D2 TaxID=1384636 RepID=UPI0007D99408|nr:hypothetical protein [Rhodococcus sp. HS-D2]